MNLTTLAHVAKRRWAAPSVLELILEATEHAALPEASAGAHVDLHLGEGVVRQYSLVDPTGPGEGHYRLGIKVQADGRGGSLRAADLLKEGATVQLGPPRNLFPLDTQTRRPVLLVAGGIGITPIHAMACELMRMPETNWRLHYAFFRRDEAYFPSAWLLDDPRAFLYETSPTEGQPRPLDLQALVQEAVAQGGADIYCCGPSGLMDELARHCDGKPSIRYVQESFSAPDLAPTGRESQFEVQLARSGRSITVATDRSILETLREAGIEVPSSCEQGVCGACETRVLAGKAQHRDAILSPSERAAGKTMMICCSRAETPSLTLDL